jgi:hypothetical protein
VPPIGSQVNTTLLAECGVAWVLVTLSTRTEPAFVSGSAAARAFTGTAVLIAALVIAASGIATLTTIWGRMTLAEEALAGTAVAVVISAAQNKL